MSIPFQLCPHPGDQQRVSDDGILSCGCCGEKLGPSPTRTRKQLMADYKASCLKHNHPDFIAPSGRCFSCGYDHTKGCTVVPSYATTGCPACHRSYCD